MANAGHSVTVAQVKLEQAHAELQVRAQSALIGERAVAIVRFVMMSLYGISTVLIPKLTGQPLPDLWVRKLLVGLYLGFCIATVVATQRVKIANPKLAKWLVGSYIFIDAGFAFANGLIDASLGVPTRPEIVTASFAVLIAFSVARVHVVHVALATATSIVGVAGLAWAQGWIDPVWTPFACSSLLALGLLIAFTNLRLSSMFADIRRRENLSRFLPRQVVERVLSAGGAPLEPVQREVTILFSDIRNFTSMSESLAPAEVLAFLDDYFGHMGQIVRGHEGMLNKFLGDGLLAVWGVPDQQSDHAERAIRTALDMRKKLVEFNQHRVREGKPEIRIGVGIHTGMVAAGMLGGTDQREYTVIGDAVNLASRIEGLTKNAGTDVLVSESTWAAGGKKFTGSRVGEEKVKGREAPVVLFKVD
ncbi:MAG: adenylate/guanylate cyclase domain-containing protein [Myxococcaceae bacterium]